MFNVQNFVFNVYAFGFLIQVQQYVTRFDVNNNVLIVNVVQDWATIAVSLAVLW